MYFGRMKTVSEIISLWGRTADFAEAVGVKYMTAHQWTLRNRVPPEHWPALVKAAKKRGFPVTEVLLAEMTAAQKRRVLAEREKARRRQRSDRQALSA